MPIGNLKISGPEDQAIAQSLADAITILTKEHLNKKPEVTAITVTFIPDTFWFIGGQNLFSLAQRSFYLDIKVTEGTNIKYQKAAYIKAIYGLLESLNGPVHPASYVYIEEVKADAYGYCGLTMEHRLNKA